MEYMKKLKQVTRQTQTISVKRKLVVACTLSILLFGGSFIYFNLSNPKEARAAVAGDYRSKASGTWNTLATWERYNGSAWVAATVVPSRTDGVTEIMSGHTVTVTAAATIDQVIVNVGGILNIGFGTTIYNGSGTDVVVYGKLINANVITLSSSSISIETGGSYVHNQDGGVVPAATWKTNSNCELAGMLSVYPTGMTQAFSNVILNGNLTNNTTMNANLNCTGNLTIALTGIRYLALGSNVVGRAITVGGNLNITSGTFVIVDQNGAASITVSGNVNLSGGVLNMKYHNGASALNITGDLNITGGSLLGREADSNIATTSIVTVGGNFNMTAGTYSFANMAAGSTLNLTGSYNHTGGEIKAPMGSGSIIFNKIGSQTFTASGTGTVSGAINYTVNNNTTLMMGTSLVGNGSTGTFTLASGGGLTIGDPGGIALSGATGNVRVSGTRTFNTGTNITYNGTTAQNAGNGLPATVTNLTINNSNGVTLAANSAVSGILTLTSGKIITAANEISVTNSSTTSIAGFSATNYIAGNLRRTVASTGMYTFPVGTPTNYECLVVTLNSTTGFSNLLAKFTNANPETPAMPVTAVEVGGAAIEDLLNYGYWSLNPNTPMTGGNYNVKASMTGYSNTISPMYYYPLLVRTNSSSAWQTNGSDLAFKFTPGTMTANKNAMTIFGDLGIGFGKCPPIFSFDNYELISGIDNTPGAVYRVADVGMALDAWIEITDFAGGATVSDFDNWTPGNGYEDAWQPFINAAANSTSSVGWKITFKKSGTAIDTMVPNIVFAAIDVDGNGSNLREFVTAYKPSSINVSAASALSINTVGADQTATGTLTTFNNIDTNNIQAMFKVNYTNVTSFSYRTGVINTGSSTGVRQASLYFRAFAGMPITVLPVELMYFKAEKSDTKVKLKWATSSEKNNDYFTIQRSADGKEFKDIGRVKGVGNSSLQTTYSYVDEKPLTGCSYYRLKQTDFNGASELFNIVSVNFNHKENRDATIKVYPNPYTDSFTAEFVCEDEQEVLITMTAMNGVNSYTEKMIAEKGNNIYRFAKPLNFKEGNYILRISSNKEIIGTTKVIFKP
jgi:hypothetical protein